MVTFPDEILLMILRLLPASAWFAFRRTCKRIRALAGDVEHAYRRFGEEAIPGFRASTVRQLQLALHLNWHVDARKSFQPFQGQEPDFISTALCNFSLADTQLYGAFRGPEFMYGSVTRFPQGDVDLQCRPDDAKQEVHTMRVERLPQHELRYTHDPFFGGFVFCHYKRGSAAVIVERVFYRATQWIRTSVAFHTTVFDTPDVIWHIGYSMCPNLVIIHGDAKNDTIITVFDLARKMVSLEPTHATPTRYSRGHVCLDESGSVWRLHPLGVSVVKW